MNKPVGDVVRLLLIIVHTIPRRHFESLCQLSANICNIDRVTAVKVNVQNGGRCRLGLTGVNFDGETTSRTSILASASNLV